jgi:hypothetical protein
VCKIHVFDAQAHALHQPQTAAIQQSGHQAVGACEGIQQAVNLCTGQDHEKALGPFGRDLGPLDALQASGIVGVRLNLIGQAVPDVTSRPWKDRIAACVKRAWHVEVYDDARRLREIVTPLGGFYLINARDLNQAIQVAPNTAATRLGERLGRGIELRRILEFEPP